MERCLWAPEDSVDLLQASILPLGYQMTESARERVGNTTAESIRRLWRKMQSTKDGKKRRRRKAETWIKLATRPDEIKQIPNDVLAQLTEDNSKLRAAVEEKAADLYDESAPEKKLWKRVYRSRKEAAKQTFNTKKVSCL